MQLLGGTSNYPRDIPSDIPLLDLLTRPPVVRCLLRPDDELTDVPRHARTPLEHPQRGLALAGPLELDGAIDRRDGLRVDGGRLDRDSMSTVGRPGESNQKQQAEDLQ